jgi:hypothetical protein
LALAGFAAAPWFAEAQDAGGGGWTPLLDENLSQWEPFLGVPHPSIQVPGYAYGKNTPVGLRDPLGVFTVRVADGEPVLHVSGQIVGGLTSLKSYENYHLRFQFRWGEKKWPPRERAPRDNGILYHCVGEHGAYDHVWMRSVEYQIQEKDVGDFFPLCGSLADFPAQEEGRFLRYTPGAPLRRWGARVLRGRDYDEKPNGEWNTGELVVIGSNSVHVLNGRVVNALSNIRYAEGKGDAKKETVLAAGRLQIQSEWAEIEYRRVEIRPAEAFPKAWAGTEAGAAP